jgi:hypothetical protein
MYFLKYGEKYRDIIHIFQKNVPVFLVPALHPARVQMEAGLTPGKIKTKDATNYTK